MRFLSSLPTRCQPFCGDLQSDTRLPCGWKTVMLLGEGEKQERIVSADREKGRLQVKVGKAVGVPCLYLVSKPKAEPQIRSQVCSDSGSTVHGPVSPTLVLHACMHTRTPAQINLFPSHLELSTWLLLSPWIFHT